MDTQKKIRIGIAGSCGRGKSFKNACDALGMVEIAAVCDINEKDLPASAERLGAQAMFTDYAKMLRQARLDAVIIGTPMHFHVPQAVAALKRNIHVLSEVPAAVSLAESRRLVAACRESTAVYMMAENYTYMRPNAIVRELVRKGLLGTTYYAEGEYIHELKHLNEVTRWRRRWQTGIAGITYGTHSLGPILQWMPGDRVVKVCAAGSGHHYRDAEGNPYENDDATVMLCQMKSGGLVKIRVDMLSDRPHAMTNYQIQGTDGCYESARAHGEKNRIWLKSCNRGADEWSDLADFEAEHLPDAWRQHAAEAAQAGHGGGDYFEVLDFVCAIQGACAPPVGIHEAMDMTLPGLVSQNSMRKSGRWLDVPDSRAW
jgi:predicted dehydrogenase